MRSRRSYRFSTPCSVFGGEELERPERPFCIVCALDLRRDLHLDFLEWTGRPRVPVFSSSPAVLHSRHAAYVGVHIQLLVIIARQREPRCISTTTDMGSHAKAARSTQSARR